MNKVVPFRNYFPLWQETIVNWLPIPDKAEIFWKPIHLNLDKEVTCYHTAIIF